MKKSIRSSSDQEFFFPWGKSSELIDNKNIITSIYKIPLYNDEPKMFAYSSQYKSNQVDNNGGGFSFVQEIALIRALGEGIERYSLDRYNPQEIVITAIEKTNSNYLNLSEICNFSKNQLMKKSFNKFRIKKNQKIKWVRAFSITQNIYIWVPLQLVTLNQDLIKNESLFMNPISTGAAEGTSLNDAVYRGICEIVERDSFMINYLNKLNSPKVDLNSIHDPEIIKILNCFKRYALEINVIDLTTDLEIPSFAAIVVDRTNHGPAISVGLKSGFEIKKTIIGAIEEALMTRFWMRDNLIYTNSTITNIDKIFRNRAKLWTSSNAIKNLNFWLENKNTKKININKTVHQDNFHTAIKLLKEKAIEVVYIDITAPEVKKYGFMVVKVIIPQLHPLYLDEQYPYLGGKRLYKIPVELGFLKKERKENQFNKIPHPFL